MHKNKNIPDITARNANKIAPGGTATGVHVGDFLTQLLFMSMCKCTQQVIK